MTEQTETNRGTMDQPEQLIAKKKKSGMGWKIGIGAIAAALVVGGVSFFALGGSTEKRLAEQLDLANRYLDELDYEQAIAYFEAAIEIDPKNEDAYLGLAEAYAGLGDYESAVEAIEEGIEQTGAETLVTYLEEIRTEQEAAQAAGNGGTGQEASQAAGDGGAGQDTEDGETEQEDVQETEDEEAETETETEIETSSPSGIGEVTAGQIVTFGSYEQDGNTANGKEPIEWYVLEASGGEAVLLSVYLLDCQPYHEMDEDTTWEKCTLRSWLNGEFYHTAFSAEEQAAIVNTNVVNEDNPFYGTEGGSSTSDKVWLLSLGEVEKYFHIDLNVYWNDYYNGTMSWEEYAAYCYGQDQRVCAKPTAYTAAMGIYTYSGSLSYAVGSIEWWLRSPGRASYSATTVDEIGSVNGSGYVSFAGGVGLTGDVICSNGVRPALKVAY